MMNWLTNYFTFQTSKSFKFPRFRSSVTASHDLWVAVDIARVVVDGRRAHVDGVGHAPRDIVVVNLGNHAIPLLL